MPHRVVELHNIMPIANIPSVLHYGVLAHDEAAKLPHLSVALPVIQQRRDKHVPGGLKLHQYANLYFCARNPMLYLRKNEAGNLCVLRISRKVLNLPGVVLADRNAASDYVRFLKSPEGLRDLNYDLIFATYWNSDDQFDYFRRKSIKCAEALVPTKVEPTYIEGAYVLNASAERALRATGFQYQITQNPGFFFY